MPTLDEIQAKNAALKAASAAGAAPQKPAAIASAVQTGIQSSAESVGEVPTEVMADITKLDEERAKKALGVFKAIWLRKYFISAVRHNPVDGYFYAETKEQLKNLKHFEALGKVEAVEVKKS